MKRRVLLAWVVVAAAAFTTACGSDSPSSPSGTGGVAVQGLVLGDGATFGASSAATSSSAKAQKVTVMVAGTTLTAEVSANGTFELKGIASGTFTLIFQVDGLEIGRVEVSAEDGSEVKIVVQVQDSVLVVVEIKVESPEDSEPDPSASPDSTACLVNGGKLGQGVQIEGNVTSGAYAAFQMAVNGRAGAPVDVSASSASFRCIGGNKAATDAECRALVKAGAKVHVRGTLLTCTSVTAIEVKVQKD
jgi:hypothetical protein